MKKYKLTVVHLHSQSRYVYEVTVPDIQLEFSNVHCAICHHYEVDIGSDISKKIATELVKDKDGYVLRSEEEIVFIDELPPGTPDTDSHRDAAYNIAYRAEPFTGDVKDNEFTMFSYSSIATLVIAGITAGLLHKGLSEEEAIEVLRSKQVRWTLDGRGDELFEAGVLLSSSMDRM